MIYGKQNKANTKEILNYNCPYCGFKFQHYVLHEEVYNEMGKKAYTKTTVIICPMCDNHLKTF